MALLVQEYKEEKLRPSFAGVMAVVLNLCLLALSSPEIAACAIATSFSIQIIYKGRLVILSTTSV